MYLYFKFIILCFDYWVIYFIDCIIIGFYKKVRIILFFVVSNIILFNLDINVG